MIDINSISPAPWDRSDWTGELVSVDGCDVTDFVRDEVDEIIMFATTNSSDWDGETAGVLKLKDGRFVAWEADWGPTGNGFCYDAYGGTSDLVFGRTVEAACSALSEKAMELLVNSPKNDVEQE